VVHTGAAHPQLNMGRDEALLHAADAPPTLRIYRWAPAAISLGYFQSSAAFRNLSGPHVLVRRMTGGGAIYHDSELTLSLALPARYLPGTVQDSYRSIHGAVGRALATIGVATSHPVCAPASCSRPIESWCFASHSAGDLLTATGRKLLGGAQRRIGSREPRVLHHASLVLRAPAATPFCGSIAESTSADADAIEATLATAIIRELGLALGMVSFAGQLSAAEEDAAMALARQRYADPLFTHRR
jgi:lipoate-protein ligase A